MKSISLIFFLILRIISNPLANVFQKKISVELSSFVINFYTYLILSLFTFPFIHSYLNIKSYPIELWLLVVAAGFLCALGTVCMIKAINIGELSVLGPINSYKSVIGLFAAFVFLREIPSFFGVIGIILIIWGSKYIFETEKESFLLSTFFKRKDIQLRFIALILTGIEAALLKKIILLSSIQACFIFWCFSGLIWSFIFLLVLNKNFQIKNCVYWKYIFLIALNLGIMQYSTNYVFSKMNVGYALALFQLSSLVTVFLGYKIFKEKNVVKKIIGSIIMIAGSVLIILF